jgi:hypothetical protein
MVKPDLPRLVPVFPRMRARFGQSKMLIPSPTEVEECIRAVPEGEVTTVTRIRDILARKQVSLRRLSRLCGDAS